MPEYILFVDDEKLIKRLVSHYFRNQIRKGEYEFIFASNGIEALEILRENPLINLVITDINMPEMDGLTLLGKIREFHENTKSIIVSAYEDLKMIRQAMSLGACDFINKPIDFQDLENTISRTLDYINHLKKNNSLEKQTQFPKTQTNQTSVVSQLITESVYEINNPINWISGNLQEAQVVIKDLINNLQLCQQQFSDIPPEILQNMQEHGREDLVSELSKVMISMQVGTDRLEQIGNNLTTQIKQ
jgi:two-component system, NtrC family, sensor kinase